MDTSNNNKTPDKNPPLPGSNDANSIDRLIENLETEVSFIETQEIVKGLTAEELEQKGFIGEKSVSVERSAFSRNRERAGLVFEETVDYTEKTDLKGIDDLDFEEVAFLKDVQPGQVVASKKSSLESENKTAIALYNEEYLKKANVQLKKDGERIQFIAVVKGKAVLLGVMLYIVKSDRDGKCDVRIAPDKMRATADMAPAFGNGRPLEKNDVITQLRERGVTAGINEAIIAESIKILKKEGKSIHDVIVAEGKLPVDAKPSEPVFFFSIDPTFEEFKILPDGRIDYHKNANIQIVKKGSVLAAMGAAQSGSDGFDITGNALKAKEAEARKLVPGENVSCSKDGGELVAEADGQVSLHGNVVSVFEHYYVNGDVDYGVGNIDFNGNVTVKGMVLSGFEVKATGDIIVMKGVESAVVRAGRDVKISGGIIGGGGDHLVCCGRNLYVNHCQNARVEAQGDVHIANSCVQSSVCCNGKVVLRNQKGAIIGGVVNALGGVEARTIGTEFGTKTEIVVGKDFLIQKTVDEFNKAIDFQNNNLQKIDKVLTPLLEMVKKGTALGEEKKEKLKLIMEKRKQIKKSIAIMENKRAELEKQMPENTVAIVKIQGTIFADVTVKIKDHVKQVSDPLEHVTIFYNRKHNAIEVGPY